MAEIQMQGRERGEKLGSHTCQISQVTQQPDEQEAHRQAIGGFGLVVGDKLGELRSTVRIGSGLWGLAEEHTRRQIHATRLMQPKMPDNDCPISVVVVVSAECIAMTDAAMSDQEGSRAALPL